ncbi:MAG: SIMPL domain-containing protein [Pyrinomonadaceae bacterium]|nr:SIMPL domain-containing protein [Pyrinomonadaceae bacterium]
MIAFHQSNTALLEGSTQTQSSDATTRATSATRVMVTGDAIVQAQPDTAIVTVGVVTQSQSALKAQQENATKSEAVLRAVKAAAGVGAEVKTSGYNLQPQYLYRENQPPTIRGYEARNAVTVRMSDLTKVGAVIDGASQAGANNVENLSFTLRQDRPARDQALTEATREALSKAQTMAQALGGRVVRIVEVQEANALRPPIIAYDEMRRSRASGTMQMGEPTPIEIGSLDIRSQVQLIAEIEMK